MFASQVAHAYLQAESSAAGRLNDNTMVAQARIPATDVLAILTRMEKVEAAVVHAVPDS